jgi:hypothetical protein
MPESRKVISVVSTGREHCGDAVVAAPDAEHPRLLAATLGQLAVEPAGCDFALVVDAGRVRLEDDLDAQS